MKNKYWVHLHLILMIFFLFTGCDYLDIVPDERVTQENLYETPNDVRNFLYSCYGYLPDNRAISNSAYWQMTGGETSFYRKENFSLFNEGAYGPANVFMTSATWGPVWQGIRQCYLFLSFIDHAKNMVESDVTEYKAEAHFLIAYYHFLSLRSYGPTLIIDHLIDQNDPVSEFPARSSYDEVVDFINAKLDEAIPGLVNHHDGNDFGRATKFAALALKSRMYLYAASPLFNGNSEMYSNFVDHDGKHLISQQFSLQKWEKSAQITKDAIDQMEAYGYRLYHDSDAGTPDSQRPGLPNKAQRRVRYAMIDHSRTNPEVIWTDTRLESIYDIQNRSAPRQTIQSPYGGNGGIAPTLPTVEMFYTDNGLPIDVDKTFDYEGRLDIVTLPVNYDGNNYSTESTGTSAKLHTHREPRFYSWIGFHNGFVEISRYDGQVTGGGDNAKKAIVLHMRHDDYHGRNGRNLYYSMTGYNNKKFVHPAYERGPVNYPWPLFRLAELYLNYAEALVELNRLDEAKVYLDKVRERAGIPSVDVAWNNFSTKPGYQNTQDGLREIVRQERSIELYLEGHKFFDIRRWKIAEQYLGIPDLGLNVDGKTDEEFFRVAEVPLTRAFHKGQYLMPIDYREIDKIPQMVQNPFY